MQNFTSKTIREIALEMPQTTRVFEEFKIDYCCGGRKPFAEACQAAGVDPQAVAAKLENAIADTDEKGAVEFPERKNASDLCDYIVAKHHVFAKNEIARLAPLMEKVCGKHGAQHAELFDIQTAFRALCDDLTPHFKKEEAVLFPYIKQMEMAIAGELPFFAPPFGTVKNPVRMMMMEHDAAGDFLHQMRAFSADYAVPPDACPSFKALYFGLEELEKDLHRHIHLENNVLFPQAVEMEETAFGEAVKDNPNRVCHHGN